MMQADHNTAQLSPHTHYIAGRNKMIKIKGVNDHFWDVFSSLIHGVVINSINEVIQNRWPDQVYAFILFSSDKNTERLMIKFRFRMIQSTIHRLSIGFLPAGFVSS